MGGKPFGGIKILGLTVGVVGNITMRCLSDYGAEVILVESSKRPDTLRTMPPFKHNEPALDNAGFFASQHPNHFGISLDLTHPLSRGVLNKLVAWADVVAENFAPGVVERWGMTYEAVKKVRPNIIMIRMSNQGQTGPHRAMASYGTHLTAFSGFTHLMGWPDRPPSKPWGAYTDFVAPRFAATALIAALEYRQRTGNGQYIDLSQLEAVCHFLAPLLLDFFVNKRVAGRIGNRSPCAAPHGAYPCSGKDKWCAVTVFTDEQWKGFCKVVGNPKWTNEPRFATLRDRAKNVDELDELIGQWTVNHSPEEVMTLMQAEGVPAGAVNTCQDLFQDPQLKYRGHFTILHHGAIGPHAYPNLPFRLSKTPAALERAAPCLGEHNEYVYKEVLKMSSDDIADLIAEGVLR